MHKELKERISSEAFKTLISNSKLFTFVKEQLQNNQSPVYILDKHYSLNYYTSLFLVILNSNDHSLNLSTILNSIRLKDKEAFTFFLKEVLENNPKAIKDNPLKTLILSLYKKDLEVR